MENKIKEMLEMQKALDASVYKGKKTAYDAEKTRLALIDEIGEMTHEMKGNWCWWKDTQKPVDRKKVLEELVDVWHFAMNIYYHECRSNDFFFARYHLDIYGHFGVSKLLTFIMDAERVCYILENLVVLGIKLGFEFDEVYTAYIEKNKINYERLKNGY